MIPPQTFHCPHCGAPGQVEYGRAEYSCMCRMGSFRAPDPYPLHSHSFDATGKCTYPGCGTTVTFAVSSSQGTQEAKP